jgi:hypothetical protein
VNDENASIGIHIELVELLHDFITFAIEEYEERKGGGPKSAKSGGTTSSKGKPQAKKDAPK